MDCCRLENATGVFLPNGKAAGKSGGLFGSALVVRRESFRMPDAVHLPWNSKKEVRPALRAFQKSDVSLLAINRTGLHLSRTKLTSDVSRPVRIVSDFLPGPLYIRPLQGRGTVAPAQWWWVSSPRAAFPFSKICLGQMLSIGVRLKSGPAAFHLLLGHFY